MSENLINKLEDEIENVEHMKFMFNERLEDVIVRLKKIRFDLKYSKEDFNCDCCSSKRGGETSTR